MNSIYHCPLELLSDNQIKRTRKNSLYLNPNCHLQTSAQLPSFIPPKFASTFKEGQGTLWVRHPIYNMYWPYQPSDDILSLIKNPSKIKDLEDSQLNPLIDEGVLLSSTQEEYKAAHLQRIQTFRDNLIQPGFLTFRKLIPPQQQRSLQIFFKELQESPSVKWQKNHRVERQYIRDHPIAEYIQTQLIKAVSPILPLPLVSSYNYIAYYKKTGMAPHKDHSACEWNISLPIDTSKAKTESSPWPLWIKTEHGTFPVCLEIGSGVLYPGARFLHWRDPLPQNSQATVCLFHFVSQI